MRWGEGVWWRIVGVLLILLGLTLFLVPAVTYHTQETIPHTRYTAPREKTVPIPPAAAVLVTCLGVVVLSVMGRVRTK